MNLFGVGALEILIILMVAFIVLGPDRLIGVARKLGTSMRELRNTTSEFSRILDEDQSAESSKEKPQDSETKG
mgnify:CR=1 FL=1